MSENKFANLNSRVDIFSFFKNAGYDIGDDNLSFPISDLTEHSIDGEALTIIDEDDITALLIKSEAYNRKSYRNKVNNYLKQLMGMKVVFYTHDHSHYNLTLIYNGVYNVKFTPGEPEMGAIRVLESLENKEDLFDYTKTDINIILLERELTAKELIVAIKEEDDSSVKIVFKDGGLTLIGKGKDKIIISQDDAPIPDMAVDVKLDYSSNEIKEEEIKSITSVYKEETGKELRLLGIITSNGVLYHWNDYSITGYIGFTNKLNENVIEDVLESLIAQVSYKTAFNSETFHQQFGTYSPFFILGIKLFKSYIEQEHEKINIMYEEWKSRFSKVYQRGDLSQELFLKHSYLSLLVKTVLISKFLADDEDLSSQRTLEKLFNIFDKRGIPIFINDFFQWSIEEINVQKEVFIAVREATFIIDDLFRTIYQEMVSPATRHALGEFFTPAPLARKMVEEVYEFGQYVLDPACGSGTFLVEILNYINNENKNTKEKIDAFSKVYGFDVNPIAILVSRSNLLLLTEKLFEDSQKIPINVYLTDSLNPIDEFTPVLKDKKREIKVEFHSLEKWSDFGEIERFNMPAINDSLIINKKFFNYSEQFGELLKEMDKNLSKDIKFDDFLGKLYNNENMDWLEKKCKGKSAKTLKDNFNHIAKKFYSYIKEDKNHIWAYLLYNAIGVRKMKETMEGVDLIIGNPPWLTINSILSYEYKEKVKDYANNQEIYMGGKHAPNTELCSIFFYKTSDLYLKKGGKIFFVATAAIESGEQHSRFRLFKNFFGIFLWKFKGDVFRIHNICIGAKKGTKPLLERLNIDTSIFNVTKKKKNYEFEEKKREIYLPYNFSTINEDQEAKRLIPKNDIEELLPQGKSEYKGDFNRGADLIPRNFFFVKIVQNKIIPDKSLLQHKPWDFFLVDEYDIEKNYIFDVCKSTELVPFQLLSVNKAFLPIETEDYDYDENKIKPKAKKLFHRFSRKYQKIQEKNERQITDLWNRINNYNTLANKMQLSEIKVVYNGVGSILKSAIIANKTIVDYSLFYIGVKNMDEAYYLCSVLNSPCLTNQIEKTGNTGASGSIRNIQKKALDFPIPRFNNDIKVHKDIVNLGKKCEKEVKAIITKLKKKKIARLKKRIKCKYCGKTYSKNSFERYRESHQEKCENVNSDHTWSDNDWIDLKDITLEDIELSRMKTQNSIFEDETMKEHLKQLDELVIKLLNS